MYIIKCNHPFVRFCVRSDGISVLLKLNQIKVYVKTVTAAKNLIKRFYTKYHENNVEF